MSQFELSEALDALLTLTDYFPKTVYAEQQKKVLELSNRPSLALYTGIPDNLVQVSVKNQELIEAHQRGPWKQLFQTE